jgi:multisubunit Na+/H+ antiporter MnhB subunit
MKRSTILYTISILMLIIAFYILIEENHSNRMSLISGFLGALGLGMNLAAFLDRNKAQNNNSY